MGKERSFAEDWNRPEAAIYDEALGQLPDMSAAEAALKHSLALP